MPNANNEGNKLLSWSYIADDKLQSPVYSFLSYARDAG